MNLNPSQWFAAPKQRVLRWELARIGRRLYGFRWILLVVQLLLLVFFILMSLYRSTGPDEILTGLLAEAVMIGFAYAGTTRRRLAPAFLRDVSLSGLTAKELWPALLAGPLVAWIAIQIVRTESRAVEMYFFFAFVEVRGGTEAFWVGRVVQDLSFSFIAAGFGFFTLAWMPLLHIAPKTIGTFLSILILIPILGTPLALVATGIVAFLAPPVALTHGEWKVFVPIASILIGGAYFAFGLFGIRTLRDREMGEILHRRGEQA